jgi:hypothetical protein
MTTIRLRNKYKFSSRIGDLVRVDPKDPRYFEYVDINDAPIIGVITEKKGAGTYVSIELLGGGSGVPGPQGTPGKQGPQGVPGSLIGDVDGGEPDTPGTVVDIGTI